MFLALPNCFALERVYFDIICRRACHYLYAKENIDKLWQLFKNLAIYKGRGQFRAEQNAPVADYKHIQNLMHC